MRNKNIISYGKIAEGEFDDIYLYDTYKVEFRRPYTIIPSVKTINFAGDPLRINTLSSGDNIYTHMKPKEFLCSLNNLTDMEWIYLSKIANLDLQIVIYKNDSVYFNGYLMPDIYNEPFTTIPYPSSISFGDGLTYLKNIDFVDFLGRKHTGNYSFIKVISWCLSQLGNDNSIIDAVNILENRYSSEDEAFLEKHYVDVEAFAGMKCYNVIEEIIKSCNSRIEQMPGAIWKITRIDQDYQHDGIVFNRDGVRQSITPTTYSSVRNITSATDSDRCVWLDNNQELSFTRGWKSVKLRHNYGRKESILPSFRMEEDDFVGEVPRGWTRLRAKQETIGETSYLKFKETTGRFEQYIKTAIPYTTNGFDGLSFEITLKNDGIVIDDNKRPRAGTNGGRPVVLREFEVEYLGTPIDSERWKISGSQSPKSILGSIGVTNFSTTTTPQFYIVFLDNPRYLDVFIPGYLYAAVALRDDGDAVIFELIEGEIGDIFSMPGNNGNVYDMAIVPYLPFEIQQPGNENLGADGIFRPNANCNLELESIVFTDNQEHTIRFKTQEAPNVGNFNLTIQKPTPVVLNNNISGGFLVRDIKLYLTSAITGIDYEKLISKSYNNEGDSIEVMFAEIETTLPTEGRMQVTLAQNETIIFTFTKGDATPYQITWARGAVNMGESFSAFRLEFNEDKPFTSLRLVNPTTVNQTVVRFDIIDTLDGSEPEEPTSTGDGSFTWNTTTYNNVVDPNQSLMYYNRVLYDDDGTYRHIKAHFVKLENSIGSLQDLSKIQQEFYYELYKRPRAILTGTLNSDVDLYDKIIYDSNIKRYLIAKDFEHSLKYRDFNGSWEEINADDSETLRDYNSDYNNDYK